MYRKIYYTLFITTSLWSCGNAQQTRVDLTPKEFQEKLKTTKEAVVIDVRTDEEVREGTIENARQINFYAPDFKEKIHNLDTTKTYFVYCKAGGRSSKAVNLMKEAGVRKLYNLNGGITAWKKERLPVVKGKR